MKKEDLIAMGLTEEQAGKVLEAHKAAIDSGYVTKTRFNEVNEELKSQKAAVADRDKQLDDLKKASGDNADLKKQIEDLQTANKEQQKKHDAEMSQLRVDNAIDSALTAAGAKNNTAVRALLGDVNAFKLGEDGTVTGLKERLEAVKKSDAYLFNESQPQANFKGFQPGASGEVKPGTKVDVSKMTYTELAAYMAANPDAVIE